MLIHHPKGRWYHYQRTIHQLLQVYICHDKAFEVLMFWEIKIYTSMQEMIGKGKKDSISYIWISNFVRNIVTCEKLLCNFVWSMRGVLLMVSRWNLHQEITNNKNSTSQIWYLYINSNFLKQTHLKAFKKVKTKLIQKKSILLYVIICFLYWHFLLYLFAILSQRCSTAL